MCPWFRRGVACGLGSGAGAAAPWLAAGLVVRLVGWAGRGGGRLSRKRRPVDVRLGQLFDLVDRLCVLGRVQGDRRAGRPGAAGAADTAAIIVRVPRDVAVEDVRSEEIPSALPYLMSLSFADIIMNNKN